MWRENKGLVIVSLLLSERSALEKASHIERRESQRKGRKGVKKSCVFVAVYSFLGAGEGGGGGERALYVSAGTNLKGYKSLAGTPCNNTLIRTTTITIAMQRLIISDMA